MDPGWASGRIGCALLVATFAQRGRSPESQRLALLASLAMVAIGAVAVGAGALSGDDEDDDPTVNAGASGTGETTTTASEDEPQTDDPTNLPSGDKDDDRGTGSDSTDTTGGSRPATDEAAIPDCFTDALNRTPRAHPDHHARVDVGVTQQVLVVDTGGADFEAVAVELVDGDEFLGVLRVGSDLENDPHIFDVLDSSCATVPATPQETYDDINSVTTITVPVQLAGRGYEVVFTHTGVNPENDVVLRQTG